MSMGPRTDWAGDVAEDALGQGADDAIFRKGDEDGAAVAAGESGGAFGGLGESERRLPAEEGGEFGGVLILKARPAAGNRCWESAAAIGEDEEAGVPTACAARAASLGTVRGDDAGFRFIDLIHENDGIDLPRRAW